MYTLGSMMALQPSVRGQSKSAIPVISSRECSYSVHQKSDLFTLPIYLENAWEFWETAKLAFKQLEGGNFWLKEFWYKELGSTLKFKWKDAPCISLLERSLQDNDFDVKRFVLRWLLQEMQDLPQRGPITFISEMRWNFGNFGRKQLSTTIHQMKINKHMCAK